MSQSISFRRWVRMATKNGRSRLLAWTVSTHGFHLMSTLAMHTQMFSWSCHGLVSKRCNELCTHIPFGVFYVSRYANSCGELSSHVGLSGANSPWVAAGRLFASGVRLFKERHSRSVLRVEMLPHQLWVHHEHRSLHHHEVSLAIEYNYEYQHFTFFKPLKLHKTKT